MSFGMMVTRLAWMAHRLVSSKRPTRYASDASCSARMACDWKRRSVLKSCAISRTRRWNGSLRISSSVDFWYFLRTWRTGEGERVERGERDVSENRGEKNPKSQTAFRVRRASESRHHCSGPTSHGTGRQCDGCRRVGSGGGRAFSIARPASRRMCHFKSALHRSARALWGCCGVRARVAAAATVGRRHRKRRKHLRGPRPT